MTRLPGLTLLTVLAALGAVVSGAAGQPYRWEGNTAISGNMCFEGNMIVPCDTVWHRPSTGDADLDRALAICDAHPNPDKNFFPKWPEYDPKVVPQCGAVLDKYAQTATAKRIADEANKEAADLAWLRDYAKGLKP